MPTVIGLERFRIGLDVDDPKLLKEYLKLCTAEIYYKMGSFDNGLRAIGFTNDCKNVTVFRTQNWVITKSIEAIDIPIPEQAKYYAELVQKIYEQICKKVPSFSRPDRHPIAVSYDPKRCTTGLIYATYDNSSDFEFQFGFMEDDMYE